jgi:hypothetical protein
MTIYVIQFSIISFFGPFLPVLMHLLRSQKSYRISQFIQSLYTLRETVQKTHLFFSNAIFMIALWRVFEKPPLLETAFLATLVQTQCMFSYQMTSSTSHFSDLDLRAVDTPWHGRNALSVLIQMAVGLYISGRKGAMDRATSREAALACYNIRGTIDVSEIFPEYSSSSALFIWIGGIIGIVFALVLLAKYISFGQSAWLSLKEWWTRIIDTKGFHISLLVASTLTLLPMTISLFTAGKKMWQFSGTKDDSQWKFAHVAAILWLPLFIDIFKEVSGKYLMERSLTSTNL